MLETILDKPYLYGLESYRKADTCKRHDIDMKESLLFGRTVSKYNFINAEKRIDYQI